MIDDPHFEDEIEQEEAPNTYPQRPVSQVIQNEHVSSLIDNPPDGGYNLN